MCASNMYIDWYYNMHQILYVFTNFQVSERLHGGPEFSGNYLIDYTIGYTTITY